MAGLIDGIDREQVTLSPDRPEDRIGEDHLVRLVDLFVEGFELLALGCAHCVPARTGRPGDHPSVLLKLFIYGCLSRIPSGRRLEIEPPSDPGAFIRVLRDRGCRISAVGLEAGPLSQWRHRHLSQEGPPVIRMATRQVKGASMAMPIKTDRRDAEGIARLLHLAQFRPVHCTSVSAQELRTLPGPRARQFSRP